MNIITALLKARRGQPSKLKGKKRDKSKLIEKIITIKTGPMAGKQRKVYVKPEDADHPANKLIDASKEFEKNRRRKANEAYMARVKKLDPDAEMTYMYGMKSGRGIMVNEKKGIAYLVHDKEGGKIRPVNLANLKKVIKGRRKSVGSLEEIFDRAPDDHIHKLLEQNEPRVVKVEDQKVGEKLATVRSFKVVDSPQGPMICEGAFKGYYLDDMVTAKQRLRGSAGYVVDPATGRAMRRVTKKNGRRMVNVFHEVYMKKQGGKARIYVPHGDTETIRLLKEAGIKREAAGGHIFTCPLHQVMGLTKILGSFSMDKEVSKAIDHSVIARSTALLRGYMDENKERIQEAGSKIRSLADKEYDGLRGYDIKGMVKEIAGKKFQLRYTQIQALRTMLGNATADEPKGSIVGLDTGLGKTLLAIAFHMKMSEMGAYKHKNNGKMCVVTINTNFPTYMNEISTFCDPKVAGEFKENPDGSYSNKLFVVYPQSKFSQRYVEGNGDAAELKKYASIVCDEPQDWMKNPSNKTYQTIANVDHPMKIISSESVMTKRPKEIVNYLNITMNKNNKEDRKAFTQSFQTMFEGKEALGMPKERFETNVREFIRDNVIYYHKTDEPTMVMHDGKTGYRFHGGRGEENCERSFHSVAIPDEVKKHYNKLAAPILKTITDKFFLFSKMSKDIDMRDFEAAVEEMTNETSGIGVAQQMSTLKSFLAKPENYIRELKGVNPKLEEASRQLKIHKSNKRVALAFAHDPELAIKSAKRFSQELGQNHLSICFTAPSGTSSGKGESSVDPGTKDAIKHNGKITVWHQGKVIKSVPVKEYMMGHGKNGKVRSMAQAMDDLLQEIKSDKSMPKSVSAGLRFGSISATDSYNAGHNLQAHAHAIFHLDRDNYNPKVLYQRESRVMRSGAVKDPNQAKEIADRLGVPHGTSFSTVTRGNVHYFDIENTPGMEISHDILEKLQGEHESKLFDRIVFQSNRAKIKDAGVTTKTAKEVFRARRKPERMLAMADLGNLTARAKVAQDADAMITSNALSA